MKVKTILAFNDFGGKEVNKLNSYKKREIGDVFTCSEERYKELIKYNVVELVKEKKTKNK